MSRIDPKFIEYLKEKIQELPYKQLRESLINDESFFNYVVDLAEYMRDNEIKSNKERG